jgi:Tachylectin
MKTTHVSPVLLVALYGLSTLGCGGTDSDADTTEDPGEVTASSAQALTDSQGVGLLFESPGSFKPALSIPRGGGAVPTSCGSDQLDPGGLCYPYCASGYVGVGPVCWQPCPAGYVDDGATCRRDAHIIDANTSSCPWYDACGLTLAPGCSSCPSGYANDGCTCRRDAHIFGQPSYGRGVGVAPSICPSGQVLDGGLCYDACPLGYKGVGPVCWIDKLDQAACEALYSGTVADSAASGNVAMSFGFGAGIASGHSLGVEAGLYYGPDGQFGCYTSTCQGATTDASINAWFTYGLYDSYDSFAGNMLQTSLGVSALYAGYSAGQVWNTATGELVGATEQVSFGVGVSPIQLSVQTCENNMTRVYPIALRPANAPDGGPGNTFYTVNEAGDLVMHRHYGGGDLGAPQVIGWGWDVASKIFAAEGGSVYAIKPDGTLWYYHHGVAGGWDNWGTQIGNGWDIFAHVFAGRFGEIYAVKPTGELYLYQHNASLGFTASSQIGSGWNVFTKLFSGGHGVLYGVKPNGDLSYSYYDLASGWQVVNLTIGEGWGTFDTVGSTGNGELYGINQYGKLRFFRHDGSGAFLAGTGGVVGSGFMLGGYGLIAASY